MTDIVDKKGDTIQVILDADFNSIQEMQFVPRQKSNLLPLLQLQLWYKNNLRIYNG